METHEDGINVKGNPYCLESLIQNAAISLRQAQPEPTPTGKHSITDAKGTVVINASKSLGNLKTYSMEEAKSLEIISANDANPFGELGQNFHDHFNEIVASSDAISAEKDRLSSALVLGTKEKSLETVADVLKGLRRPDPISGAFPQSRQALSQRRQEHQKSDESPRSAQEVDHR